MANHPLRNVVAVALVTIERDGGYIPPSSNSKSNTQTRVLDVFKSGLPTIGEMHWRLADEMITYFKTLTPGAWQKRSDAALIQACVDATINQEVTSVSFPYAVMMPQMYGLLFPAQKVSLNALTSEAVLSNPGEHLGMIGHPCRLFVKLVRVGAHDAQMGGTLFEVHDRNENIAYFYERPERLESKIQLSDCFAIHATPSRHSDKNGTKFTILRDVSVVDKPKRSPLLVPKENDATGRFVKSYPNS